MSANREGMPAAGEESRPGIERNGEADRSVQGAGQQQEPQVHEGWRLIRASEIPVCEMAWVWPGRIAQGSLTAIFGPPGSGKSAVALDLAARVSRGASWPNAPHAEQEVGSVLIQWAPNADHPGTDPRPRAAAAAGADSGLIARQVFTAPGPQVHAGPILQARNVAMWNSFAERTPDLRLVIIDELAPCLGVDHDWRTGELARLLRQLREFADRHDVAVVLVNANDPRSAGKKRRGAPHVVEFIHDAARAVFTVETDPHQPGRHTFLAQRVNYAAKPPGLAFTIERPTGRVVWSAEAVGHRVGRGRAGRA